MLSKNELKKLKSFARKKQRDEAGVFIAEGPKLVAELMPAFRCRTLVGTAEYFRSAPPAPASASCLTATPDELRQISLLATPHQVWALFERPADAPLSAFSPKEDLILALESVQDPGNMGTILRIADWFGIRSVFLSEGCVDAFSPKVVQATMGALTRVSLCRGNLAEWLSGFSDADVNIYGTFLDGADLYQNQNLQPRGVIVMGNEGNGISPEVARCVNSRLLIPPFPADASTVESLNVAVATAVVCAEFRRRQSFSII